MWNHAMLHTVLCLANDQAQSETIVAELLRAGFTADEISLLTAADDNHHGARSAAGQSGKLLGGVASGVGHGGVIGAAIGWMAGLGAITLPGIGPTSGSGPLMAALGGAAVGAAVAGVGSALAMIGLPAPEAQRYEDIMRAGSTLVSVRTANGYEIDTILDIFRQAGAQHCSSSTGPGAPAECPVPSASAVHSRESALFHRAPRYA
jgi:hypothetical protein